MYLFGFLLNFITYGRAGEGPLILFDFLPFRSRLSVDNISSKCLRNNVEFFYILIQLISRLSVELISWFQIFVLRKEA